MKIIASIGKNEYNIDEIKKISDKNKPKTPLLNFFNCEKMLSLKYLQNSFQIFIQMLNRHNWMMDHHSWAGIAHNFFDF